MGKKTSDFRYNTGEAKVPWAAVGENYNARDLKAVVRFLMQGQGEAYNKALAEVNLGIDKLAALASPPGKLSLGTQVEKAEAACDAYLGTRGSLLLANCTAGFEIAYKYANIGPGDEVIVPAITFIATMAYPLSVGAKLVFADIDPKTVNMDPADVARKISPRTKMIVPVDIGGYPADMDPIMELAGKHGILVLEDAAHAFGAKYKGRMVGTIADFSGFSFHEVKNSTSFGEGGLLTTNIADFRSDMRRARFLGLDFTRTAREWLYDVTAIPGKFGPAVAGNASVTEIQALGLILQLGRYEQILAERRRAAAFVTRRLSANPAIVPQDLGGDDYSPTFHLYQIQIDPEKAGGDVRLFKKKMTEKGVTNIPHFGPLYRFEVLKQLGYNPEAAAESCPVCEDVFYRRYTHLPIYGLSDEQLAFMADTALECVAEMQAGE
ncbi:MAG: DegT/DnrJ/EryC1/StrS family aminotransferase [Spirochaetaceae bacterium]|jgi:dTDP-4-amino-4,6-dideoxygalactose transaminase|nr:DegT/DnrJ/EryC1/StrS family aminotransferase [Spirochaetaceae bacterium]